MQKLIQWGSDNGNDTKLEEEFWKYIFSVKSELYNPLKDVKVKSIFTGIWMNVKK